MSGEFHIGAAKLADLPSIGKPDGPQCGMDALVSLPLYERKGTVRLSYKIGISFHELLSDVSILAYRIRLPSDVRATE